MKQRSLLKANWWPRIIGKVNPLNLIERTARAESKIHFYRRSSVVEKILEGAKKKPIIILLSPNMRPGNWLVPPRRFYHPHKDLQNTPRSYFTVTTARYFVQRGVVPAIRFTKAFAIRPSSVDEIGETWNWIDPTGLWLGDSADSRPRPGKSAEPFVLFFTLYVVVLCPGAEIMKG